MLSKKQLSFLIVVLVCLSCLFGSVATYNFPIVQNNITPQNDFNQVNDFIAKTDGFFSNNNYLKSLTITEGYTLEPAFDKEHLNYKVHVPFEVKQIELKYELEDPKAIIHVKNLDATKDLKTGSNIIEIEVVAESFEKRTYIVDIERAKNDNCYLRTLGIYIPKSDTEVVDIGFDKDILTYNVDVPFTVDLVDIRFELDSIYSTYKVVGDNSLKEGLNIYQIDVTAENGNSNIYTLNITRKNHDASSNNSFLKKLEVENFHLSPRFDKNIKHYNVAVSYETTKININAIAEDANAVVHIVPENLTIGVGTTVVEVNVTAPNSSHTTYYIDVFKDNNYQDKHTNNNLKELTISDGTKDINISPQINEIDTEYRAWVNYRTDNIFVKVRAADTRAQCYVVYDDVVVENKQPIILDEGINIIKIEVVAEDGNLKLYKLKVEKEKYRDAHTNNNLKQINIVGYNLNPEFDPKTTTYNITVTDKTKQLEMYIACEDQYATYEVLGNENFIIGENTITIKVTAEDGTEKDYYIKITRPQGINNNYLKSINVDDYKLSPAFNKEIMEYTVIVPFTTQHVFVTAVPEDPMAQCTVSHEGYNLDGSKDNIITITVTAQNNDVRKYKLTIVLSKDYDDGIDDDKNKNEGIHNSTVMPGGSTLGIPNWLLGIIIVIVVIVLAVFGTLLGSLVAQKKKYKIKPYEDKNKKVKKTKEKKPEEKTEEKEENTEDKNLEEDESSEENPDEQ